MYLQQKAYTKMASLLPATPVRAATRLRQLLKDREKILICPGVYDGITARIALSLGFETLYMVEDLTSGSGTLLI